MDQNTKGISMKGLSKGRGNTHGRTVLSKKKGITIFSYEGMWINNKRHG